jgi:pimeloyl-ACP methyl ester carboxylesterase
LICLYALALAASWGTQWLRAPTQKALSPGVRSVILPIDTTSDPRTIRVAYREWAPPPAPHTPVVGTLLLMHGSPGDGAAFASVGESLSARGFRVLAPDLPGFGESSRWPSHGSMDLSVRANAHRMLALLDALHVDSVHILGWSNGGGTALWMADLAPPRVASLTLLAAIGCQEYEGSGNFHVEHAKYALGKLLLGYAPQLFPHFGRLGSINDRIGWLRNFDHTDQRELRPLLARLAQGTIPTLIIHGRHDVLVPLRAAEATHRLLPRSRLVVTDANHFMPFMQAGMVAQRLDAWTLDTQNTSVAPTLLPAEGARSDDPAAPPRASLLGQLDRARAVIRWWPWWSHVLLLALCTMLSPGWGFALAGLLVTGPAVDPFVALLGVLTGSLLAIAIHGRRIAHARSSSPPLRHDWSRRIHSQPWTEGWRAGVLLAWRNQGGAGLLSTLGLGWRWGLFALSFALALALATMISLVAASLLVGLTDHALASRVGWWAIVPGLLLAAWIAPRIPGLLSIRGLRWARIRLERATNFEYWPTLVIYLCITPALLWLAIRHRTLSVWAACNPGIPECGGLVGERKHEILRELDIAEAAIPHPRPQPCVLRWIMIPANGTLETRLQSLHAGMLARHLEWPIILKPDIGERGYAVKLARSQLDARTYLASVTCDVIAQQFHPGPNECGILWARCTDAQRLTSPHTNDRPAGFLYSITAKQFPRITGDGVRTLEELIETHPRFRRQHRVFLERFAHDASRVLASGEQLALGVAGNHCQGTLFGDGAHLITPELTRALDAIAARYGDPSAAHGTLDYARFDLRYVDDESLRQGTGFAIVEMNGTSSESTNIYDPAKPLIWSLRVLLGQWKLLALLGKQRVREGAPNPTALGVLRVVLAGTRVRATRGGRAIAD